MHRIVEGIVLRETETKETDKILTVLTRTEGKLAVVARGARRRRSRIAAAAQLLVYSEMTLYQKGNWSILDDASTIELFDGVRQDVELLALGSYFAELTELLTAEDVPAPEILSLLLNALYVLGTLPEEPMLDVVQGVLHCRRCVLEGRRGLSMPLCASSLAAMRHVLRCAPKKLYAFSLSPGALRWMEDAAEAFAAAQLERGFCTLDFYKQLRRSGGTLR